MTSKSKPKTEPKAQTVAGGLPTDPRHPLYSPLTVDGNKR